MKLTEIERLTLMNQYQILSFLDKENQDDYERKAEILRRGYKTLYGDLTEYFDNELSEEDGQFVLDVLNMFLAIRRVAEDEGVDLNTPSNESIQFAGFDGNNESEILSFAKFLAQEPDSAYAEFLVGKYMPNSHTRSVGLYTRLLEEFKEIGDFEGLQAAGVAGLERLKAVAVHPSNR